MSCGIYWIKNTVNNNCYIGSSHQISKRWYEHKRVLNKNQHHSIVLQRAWNKYGADKFVFEIILECEREELINEEQKFFDTLKPAYNSSKLANAPGGYIRSDETREKMRKAKVGKKLTPEHIAKSTKNWTIELAKSNQKLSYESRKNGKGWGWSEEAKRKIGLANTPLVYGYDLEDNLIHQFDNFKLAAEFLEKSEITLWRIIKNEKVVKNCKWKKIKRNACNNSL